MRYDMTGVKMGKQIAVPINDVGDGRWLTWIADVLQDRFDQGYKLVTVIDLGAPGVVAVFEGEDATNKGKRKLNTGA